MNQAPRADLRRPDDLEGWAVIDAGLAQAASRLGSRLASAFAIGSLAHGGFAPAASDVDLAMILTDLKSSDEGVVRDISAAVAAAIPSALAQRLSIFWSSWSSLADGDAQGRFPLADRLDLAQSGACLLGLDRRESIRLPSGGALADALVVEGASFMRDRLATPERNHLLRSPAALIALGCRDVTKAVLFPARFLFTLASGRVARNEDAADYVRGACGEPIRRVVEAAYQARLTGRFEPAAMLKHLTAGLVPLYDEMIEGYAERLSRLGEPQFAVAMLTWKEKLHAER